MPAYRSSAEADIREAVVSRIRERRPNARIIHEINIRDYNTNRIDVLAVDRSEIIAVEIKSEKDKLDRLPSQISAMARCSHRAIAAIHEKFLVEEKTNKWAAHYERDGEFYRKAEPKLARDAEVWVFPERSRALDPSWHDALAKWRFPDQSSERALPQFALCLLWREELQNMCHIYRVSCSSRSTVSDMQRSLLWRCTGKELTEGVCRQLRGRECAEADQPIYEKEAS